jgi:multiple sugar transport system substrate-binding protein
MSKLQIIIIIIFLLVALIAVLMFAGILPGFESNSTGSAVEVKIWGPFSNQIMSGLINNLNQANKETFKVSYSEKKSVDYRNDLINALASGNGPDIWIMTQDNIITDASKVYLLPQASFSERNFKDTFIDQGELFFNYEKDLANNITKKIIGLPLAVDPIVLYWNKDIFSSGGISQSPKTWDEFMTDVQTLTQKDAANNIVLSGAAMGEFSNIKNAKEILSMLILQGGNKIVDSETKHSVLGEKGDNLVDPGQGALRFFDEFSNPSKLSYSWNKALSSSDTAFTNGSLAMYFGFASEAKNIKQKNPHLNFDISEVPQIKDSKNKITFGKMYSLVIAKNSPNLQTAFSVIISMTAADFEKSFSEEFDLGATRRDVLSQGTPDSFLSVVYKSSIMSRAWLEPDASQVSVIFKNMIELTSTGKLSFSEAVSNASRQIGELLK